jgi:hypothetical protein
VTYAVRLALLAVGALLSSGSLAVASTGVSIDVGSIDVREQLSPGGEYRLPTFGVRNPGDEESAYVVVVSYVDGQAGLSPPEGWFTFSPVTFSLAAGEARPVNTTLEIPADAEPGDYAALIGPQVVAAGGGATVGAGAAARLTFTVQPSSPLDAWLRWLWRFLGQHPWVWILALGLTAVVIVAILRRRFSIAITRRLP